MSKENQVTGDKNVPPARVVFRVNNTRQAAIWSLRATQYRTGAVATALNTRTAAQENAPTARIDRGCCTDLTAMNSLIACSRYRSCSVMSGFLPCVAPFRSSSDTFSLSAELLSVVGRAKWSKIVFLQSPVRLVFKLHHDLS